MCRVADFVDDKPLTSLFIFMGGVVLWVFEGTYLQENGMEDYSGFLTCLPIALFLICITKQCFFILKDEWK